VYRRHIDSHIESALAGTIFEALGRRFRRQQLKLDGQEEGEKETSFGVHIAELCCGDGSLSQRLLLRFGPVIKQYHMIERNGTLAKLSRAKAASVNSERQEATDSVDVLQIDVLTLAGQEALQRMQPLPDVWIASGSTLNGQVGSPTMAEPTLRAMASQLSIGGFLIVTGFTVSFLNPALIALCGLQVVEASIPGIEEVGMVTELGQFQFFVLRKAVEVAAAVADTPSMVFDAAEEEAKAEATTAGVVGGGPAEDSTCSENGGQGISGGCDDDKDHDDDDEFDDDDYRTFFNAMACCPLEPPFNHESTDKSTDKSKRRSAR
jgi:hypothetical protein